MVVVVILPPAALWRASAADVVGPTTTPYWPQKEKEMDVVSSQLNIDR